jgi:hypothetical protein
MRNRYGDYCGIYSYIFNQAQKSQNSRGALVDRLLEQADLLDLSRPTGLNCSGWWQIIKTNTAQLKKAFALEEKLVKTTVLSQQEKDEFLVKIQSA